MFVVNVFMESVIPCCAITASPLFFTEPDGRSPYDDFPGVCASFFHASSLFNRRLRPCDLQYVKRHVAYKFAHVDKKMHLFLGLRFEFFAISVQFSAFKVIVHP